jgi:hypothetical protein
MSLRIRIVLLSTAAIWLVILGLLSGALGRAPSTEGESGIPREFVGKWGAGESYCSDIDRCADGDGSSVSFSFHRSGRTDYFLFQSARVEGCWQVRSLARKSGKIEVTGNSITFLPAVGMYETVNECRADLTGSWSFETEDLEPVVLHWQFEKGKLRITDPGGEASGVYDRR